MTQTYAVELEVAPGIEDVAVEELIERYAGRLRSQLQVETGSLRFAYQGNLGGLLALQTIQAAYLAETYDIPRPKAFLGHEHLTRLLAQIQTALNLSAPDAYTTIHINAAGSQSSVMQRLLNELAKQTNLQPDIDDGDLVLRLRRAVHGSGWDALVRLSPRPTATRDWRVVNLPGALNAAVAHAMVRLSDPHPDDVILNAMCGSGTLAIERLKFGDARRVIACDINEEALNATQANISAAGLEDRIELNDWDVRDLLLSPNSVDVAFADLPFGNLMGSHETNVSLYPALLQEVARVVKSGGHFILITHELRLMDAVLRAQDRWKPRQQLPITLSGLHPRIYVLLRL